MAIQLSKPSQHAPTEMRAGAIRLAIPHGSSAMASFIVFAEEADASTFCLASPFPALGHRKI